MDTPIVEKKVVGTDALATAKQALATANEAASMTRRLGKRLEDVFGLDLDGDGQIGRFEGSK